MKTLITLLSTVLVPMIFLSVGKSQNLTLQDDLNEGTHLEFIMHSPSLEGNFLGDSPDRWISVYLPPGYYDSPDKHYPVIYFLHSYYVDHTTFFGGLWEDVDFNTICDDLINSGEIDSMIVVSPNSYNLYGGSFYTNSFITGNWEDFITQDVIHYMDRNFRTLPQTESRGLAGHSMGGYGTIWLIMNNPEIFNAAYMLSGVMDLTQLNLTSNDNMIKAINADNIEGLEWQILVNIAQAAAFAPDSLTPPFYAQFPLDDSGELIDSIWQKWLQHDPYTLLPFYKDSLLKLQTIQFDCGINDDPAFIDANRNFSAALNDLGITHVFEEHDGDHSNKLAERIETKLLPFFSAYLSDTMIADTSFYSLIEWQGFEAKENYRLNETVLLDTSTWVSDSLSYEIVSGDPDNIFSINNDTREITADSLKLDYEEKTYHNLLVVATYQNGDEMLNDTANIFIRIENLNDNPPVIRDATFSVKENSPKYTQVGYVQATDADGNLLELTITDGNINETFSILNSGLVRVADVSSLDYESISQFVLTVVVTETDGLFSDTAFVTINVEDVVDIRAHESLNKLAIHPNPSDDIINIEINNPNNAIIEIYNVSGMLVLSKELNSKAERIDISGLSEGMYIIKVMQDRAVNIGKVIVR